MKLDSGFDYAENAAAYMSAFERPKYNKYKNDEFEFDEQKAKEVSIMKAAVAKVDPNTEYTLTTDTSFGTYDFATESYPFTLGNHSAENFPGEAFPDGIYFSINPGFNGKYQYVDTNANGTIPSDYRLTFTNPTAFGKIKLDKEAAKALLKERTKYGSVNRSLDTVLTIKIKSVGNKLEGNNPTATAEIEKITFYKDQGHKKVLYVAMPEGTEAPKS